MFATKDAEPSGSGKLSSLSNSNRKGTSPSSEGSGLRIRANRFECFWRVVGLSMMLTQRGSLNFNLEGGETNPDGGLNNR
jgi:hypothetical protein